MSKLTGFTKRITAMLLSGMLIFGSASGSVLAASTDVDPGQTSEIAEEMFIEDISEEPASVGEAAEEASAEEEAQYYTVTLDANGGYFENEWDDSIGDYAQQAEVVEKHIPVDGTVAAIPVFTDPDGQAMLFAGWSLERDGELVSKAEEEYIPVDNCVLYAVWQMQEQEAVTDDVADAQKVYEETADLGMTAGENSDDFTNGDEYSEEDKTEEMPLDESNADGEAVNYYTVILDANGGYFKNEWDDVLGDYAEQAEVVNKYVPVGGTVSSFPVFPVQVDQSMVFAGWSLERNGELITVGDEEYAPVDNCVLYAVWQVDGSGIDSDNSSEEAVLGESVGAGDQEEVYVEENTDQMDAPQEAAEIESKENVDSEDAIQEAEEAEIVGESDDAQEVEDSVIVDDSYESRGEEDTDPNSFTASETEIKNETSDQQAVVPEKRRSYADEDVESTSEDAADVAVAVAEEETQPMLIEDSEEEETVREDASTGVVESGTCGGNGDDNLTWTLDEEGTLVISGTGEMESYSKGYTSPFWKHTIIEVIIEEGVTSIGDNVFYRCFDLTSITIPDSVTSIGSSAFYECSSLTSITIPDSVTSIGSFAFYECSSLTSITIPDSVNSIGDNTFKGCSSLTSITIPDSVTSIGLYVFEDCSNVVIHGSQDSEAYKYALVYRIPFKALEANCNPVLAQGVTDNGLTWAIDCAYVLIIEGNGEIEDYDNGYPWRDNEYYQDIRGVFVGSGISYIGRAAFSFYQNLRSVTLCEGVEVIGQGAFQDCKELKSVKLPNTLKRINSSAFYDCNKLRDFTLPDSLNVISNYAFGGCDSLTTITIPEGVTVIGNGAFYRCYGLTSIVIPISVTSIGEYAFSDCYCLTNIEIPEGIGITSI